MKTEIFKAYVVCKSLNVRIWADSKSEKCSFSPLMKGDFVSVCDAIMSRDGAIWYYILHKGKYGFVNSAYVQSIPTKAVSFVSRLDTYHNYIKEHAPYFHYYYDSNIKSFQIAKNEIADKKMVGITCVVPIRWALYALNVKREDGKSLIVGYNGTFATTYTGNVRNELDRITSGVSVGKTVYQAVNKGLLKAGDIICFEGMTHTFVYSGKDYICYDGGHAAIVDGVYTGIKVDYSKANKNRKISEILRWKE